MTLLKNRPRPSKTQSPRKGKTNPMTKITNIALIAYGVMCIAMGVQASFFPHEGATVSMVSLYAAGGLGLLMIASVYIWTKSPRVGRIMAVVLALLSLVRFAPKVMKEQQIYPAGITVIASIIVIALLVAGHMQGMKERKAGSGE
jgi:uncharacterized membrane protein (UPF0136 family)